MKKFLAILLCMAMLFLTACGGGDVTAQEGSSQNNTTQQGAPAEEKVPDYVKEPITIELWHTFGSGQQATYMEDAIARFNAENEYGITVIANYIGGYVTLRTNLTTAIGAKNNPQVAILGLSDILASNNVLADMSAYAKRDGIDLNSFNPGVETSMYCDGKLTAMPFARSCTLFYYNIDMWKEAGYNAPPQTIAELEEMASTVAAKQNCYGFEMLIDVSFYQEALLRSMGAEGIINLDKTGASCLDDGSLEKLLTDWKRWIDEGWCAAPSITDGVNSLQQQLFSGKLASCCASSASMGTILTYGKEAGINIGVAPMPGYDGTCGVGSGGDISIISANNNQQQIAASWELVKFFMSDEEVARRSEMTGYMPTSAGSATLMEELFNSDENYRIAYETRLNATDVEGSVYRSEWQNQVAAAVSYVIQDKSMTPAEAVQYLKDMLITVFY